MDIILTIVIPVFGVLLIGYGAARFGFFDEMGIRGLSLFVFNFAVPMLLFRTLANTELPAEVPWDYLLSYYLGTFAVFGFGMLTGRVAFARRLDEQGILGFNAAYSNSVLLGIPLVLTTFGEAASLPLFIIIALHSLLLFPTVTVIIEASRGRGAALRHIPINTLKGLLKNPLIIGLSLGLIFSLFELPVPAVVDAVAETLVRAVTPCALFAMGASLNRYHIAGNLREALALMGLKNFLHPLLVWALATLVFEIEPLWAMVAVLLAALPAGVNVFLFAQRYQICIATVTSMIFISTAVSIFSLSALLFLFEVR